jgi:hypothetical protein
MRPSTMNGVEDAYIDPRPSWASLWHIWTLIIPRRSIDGSRIWGRVWRRHDGRRWIYKRISTTDELE